jgi:glyoxylase-like metal-dependent hydrolase (beta-lactamase superfamily II)
MLWSHQTAYWPTILYGFMEMRRTSGAYFWQLPNRSRHFDVFDIGVPNEDCDAITFPNFVVEFCAGHTLDNCSVRIERGQPSSPRLD